MKRTTILIGNGLKRSRYVRARILKNFTQTKVAKRAGVTQGYYSKLENGLVQPCGKTLRKICRFLDIPYDGR